MLLWVAVIYLKGKVKWLRTDADLHFTFTHILLRDQSQSLALLKQSYSFKKSRNSFHQIDQLNQILEDSFAKCGQKK